MVSLVMELFMKEQFNVIVYERENANCKFFNHYLVVQNSLYKFNISKNLFNQNINNSCLALYFKKEF